MNLLDYFRRQFIYNAWANSEVFSALNASGNSESKGLRLLAHILSAERLWLERIKSQPQGLPVWPDFTMERCRVEMENVAKRWREHLDQISMDQLSEKIRYKNSKGEEWASSVENITSHVLLHSAYHRGQIASQMRAEGKQPVYTDFIHATRQGLIK
ncbi:MAG TPA: DinB family protein [Candidatus Aquilonibacter sp.]|nr:DinB family protein [Candidatus Aquilonibacter sp.]